MALQSRALLVRRTLLSNREQHAKGYIHVVHRSKQCVYYFLDTSSDPSTLPKCRILLALFPIGSGQFRPQIDTERARDRKTVRKHFMRVFLDTVAASHLETVNLFVIRLALVMRLTPNG
jgi:hypothetical protein